MPCTFFQVPLFWDCGQQCISIGCCLSLVDLSTIAALSCKQHCRSGNKTVWIYCYYFTTIHFNNLFWHRLCKLHCVQPSSGKAVANSALRFWNWKKNWKRVRIWVWKNVWKKSLRRIQKAESGFTNQGFYKVFSMETNANWI